MSKRYFLLSFFVFLILFSFVISCQKTSSLSGTSQPSVSKGKAVAQVGDFIITEGDVAKHRKRMPRIGNLKTENVIEDLITSKLLYLGAKQEHFDQDPEVQEQIERVLGKIYIMRKIASFGKSEQELKDYYEAHRDKFKLPHKAEISHILLPSQAKAEQTLADIRQGKITFEEAAKTLSLDTNTARQGGKVGTVAEGNYVPIIGINPDINQAIFGAQKGDLIGPFKTDKGYHLIKVNDFNEPEYLSFERAKGEIINNLVVSDQEVEEYYQQNKDKRFKKKAFVKIKHIQLPTEAEAKKVLARIKKGESFSKLVAEVSTDQDTVNKGGDLGLIYQDGYIPRIGKDEDFLNALFKLEEGAYSPVLKSNVGYHIVQVYEKKPAQYHDLSKVEKRIRGILVGQKRVDQKENVVADLEKKFKVKRLYKKESPAAPTQPKSPGKDEE